MALDLSPAKVSLPTAVALSAHALAILPTATPFSLVAIAFTPKAMALAPEAPLLS